MVCYFSRKYTHTLTQTLFPAFFVANILFFFPRVNVHFYLSFLVITFYTFHTLVCFQSLFLWHCKKQRAEEKKNTAKDFVFSPLLFAFFSSIILLLNAVRSTKFK